MTDDQQPPHYEAAVGRRSSVFFYRLARRGRNERVKTARGAVARVNGLPAVSVFRPPNPGNITRVTDCPVNFSIARTDSSSTGVTIVIARPVLPAPPARAKRMN